MPGRRGPLATGSKLVGMVRYRKAQSTVLLCGGLVGPIFLMDVLGTTDIHSNPVVREQVMGTLHRASAQPPAADPALTVSQQLQQLELLHATGSITQAEYAAKRREILADLRPSLPHPPRNPPHSCDAVASHSPGVDLSAGGALASLTRG